MNPFTGHLIPITREGPPPDGYERVPAALEREAIAKLLAAERQGLPSAVVNLKGRSRLANWAKKKRKAKIAAASKRRNRNG